MSYRYRASLPFLLALLVLPSAARYRATPVATWQATSLFSDQLTTLAVDDHNAAVVYAGTSTGLVYYTQDEARTFHKAALSPRAPITSIGVDPTISVSVYVLTSRGLYHSATSGSWTRLAARGLSPMASLHTVYVDSSGLLYAGGTTGLWRSTDHGASFRAVKLEKPAAPGTHLDVWAIKADTRRASRIYAASSAGIYVGDAGEATWHLDDSPGPLAALTVASRATGGTVYTLSADGRATAFSGDGLKDTLTQIDTPIGVIARDLATGAGNRLYAGTQGSGVYVSTDGGQHWLQVGNGLPSRTVLQFAQSTLVASPLIYARTPNGLFRFLDH